jgi:excisionase family DNA binding protein
VAASEEQFLSLEDVASRLQVSDQTVRRWVKSGKLTAYKPGLEYRIREADLEEFLRAREVRPKAPRRSPLEPTFNDVLAEERHYRPTAQDVRALDRYLSRLERELAEDTMRQRDIERELDVVRAFGPAVCAAMSGETVGRMLLLSRGLLEKAKEMKALNVAEAEAGVTRLEEWANRRAS